MFFLHLLKSLGSLALYCIFRLNGKNLFFSPRYPHPAGVVFGVMLTTLGKVRVGQIGNTPE